MADVLIVEDDEKTRQSFCLVMKRLGHSVRAATSFSSARTEISRCPPDLVLTDWNLSLNEDCNGSGIDIAKYSLTNNPYTAVVMITGNNIDELKSLTHSLPIKAYVKKPVDLTSFRAILNDVLEP